MCMLHREGFAIKGPCAPHKRLGSVRVKMKTSVRCIHIQTQLRVKILNLSIVKHKNILQKKSKFLTSFLLSKFSSFVAENLDRRVENYLSRPENPFPKKKCQSDKN